MRVGELCLHSGWRVSLKVGGARFRQILAKDPKNEDILKLVEYAKQRKKEVNECDKTACSSSSSSSSSSCSSSFPGGSSSITVKQEKKDEEEQKVVVVHPSPSLEELKEKKTKEKKDFQDEVEKQAENLKVELEKRGEDEEIVKNSIEMFKNKKMKEYMKKVLSGGEKEKVREKQKEVVDLTLPDPTFSQQGIFPESVREVFGLRGWELESGFLEEKFYRYDTRDFESPEYLPGRKKMWDWMVGCVEGPDPPRKNYFVPTF